MSFMFGYLRVKVSWQLIFSLKITLVSKATNPSCLNLEATNSRFKLESILETKRRVKIDFDMFRFVWVEFILSLELILTWRPNLEILPL